MNIHKDDLKENDIPYIDSMEHDTAQYIIKQLQAIQPDFVDTTGAVNIDAIRQAVNKDNIAPSIKAIQGYGLNFAGKSIANHRAEPNTRTKKLQFVPEQSKRSESTENIIIRGDNEQVLKILCQNYHQKIKMIYIDPPYNTQSDGFTYKDNFKESKEDLIEKFNLSDETVNYLENIYSTESHNGWLVFMYTRLKLARNLLTDDGVIFISIDDNEQANLKILCDEIFGESNFIACFTWTKKEKASGVPPKNMSLPNKEYILTYGKNINIKFKGQKRSLKSYKQDKNGRYWRTMPIQATGKQNSFYTIVDPKTNKEYYGNWAFKEETILQMIYDNKIVFPENAGRPQQIVYADTLGNSPIFHHLGFFDSEVSTKKVIKLFNNTKVFDFPKPLDLITFLVEQSTTQNDIILDFFAGSGTTAHAVMDLNATDNGKRKFILVQLDEDIDLKKSKTAYDFCIENNFKPFISSITLERVNRAGEKIIKDTPNKDLTDLDIGYKVFKTTDKDDLKPNKDGSIQYNLTDTPQYPTDILYNMMCETAVPLHTPIKTIIQDKLYMVNDAVYIVDKINISDLERYMENQIFVYHRSGLSLQDYLNIQQTHRYFKAVWG